MQTQLDQNQKQRYFTPMALLLTEAASVAVEAVKLDKGNQPASAISLYLHAARLILDGATPLMNGQGRLNLVKKATDYLFRASYLIAQEAAKNSDGARKVEPTPETPASGASTGLHS